MNSSHSQATGTVVAKHKEDVLVKKTQTTQQTLSFFSNLVK